jgi:hypothetical protein
VQDEAVGCPAAHEISGQGFCEFPVCSHWCTSGEKSRVVMLRSGTLGVLEI